MKKGLFIISKLMALCLLSATLLLVQFNFAQAQDVTKKDKKDFEAVILKYLKAKNIAKVTGDIDKLRADLESMTKDLDIQNQAISEAAIEYTPDQYIGAETTIKFLGEPQKIKGGHVQVLVEEDSERYYSFDIRAIGGPDKTGELIEHIITLSKTGNGVWHIVSDIIKNGPKSEPPIPGLPPIPPETPSTTVAPQGTLLQEDLNEPSNEPLVQTTYYSGSAAASYARMYAKTPNPSYRYFSADCTNFVSQALRTGGWWDVPGYYQSTSAWWYNSLNQTWTWTGAHYFWLFTKNRPRGYIARYFSDMQLGDILQMDYTNDGYSDHSMVVTAKDSYGTIYLFYHTTNTLNRSINSILSQYPNARYSGWRIYSYIN